MKGKKIKNKRLPIILLIIFIISMISAIYVAAATQISTGSITLCNVNTELVGDSINGFQKKVTFTLISDTGGDLYYSIDEHKIADSMNKISTDPQQNIDGNYVYNISETYGLDDTAYKYLHIKNSYTTYDFTAENQSINSQKSQDGKNINIDLIDTFKGSGDDYGKSFIINQYLNNTDLTNPNISVTTHKNKKVRVLNVFPNENTPDFDSANVLQQWMQGNGKFYNSDGTNIRGWGRGLIDVTPMSLSEFNNDPSVVYKYDMVAFGTWDDEGNNLNGDIINGKFVSTGDITEDAANMIRDYVTNKNGKMILGHDTLNTHQDYEAYKFETLQNAEGTYPGNSVIQNLTTDQMKWHFNQFADLADITLVYEPMYWSGTEGINGADPNDSSLSDLTIVENSTITKFPWNIGNQILKVPLTHMLPMIPNGDVPIKFDQNLTAEQYNDDFYLTISKNKNVAMIETGHSNARATDDEQKIWANLILYLSGSSDDNSNATMELKDTNNPTISTDTSKIDYYNKNIQFSVADEGTDNTFLVENTNIIDTLKTITEPENYKYTSNIKETKYYFTDTLYSDNDTKNLYRNNIVDSSLWDNNTQSSNLQSGTENINFKKKSDGTYYKYVYAATVDNSGNISDTVRLDLTPTSNPNLSLIKYPNNVWTNGNVDLTAWATDPNFIPILDITSYIKNGNVSIDPTVDKNTTNSTLFIKDYNVGYNGTYKFSTENVFNQSSGNKTIDVNEIDKDIPSIVTSTLPSSNWTNQDVDLNIKCSDNTSGIKSVSVYDNKTSQQVTSLSKNWNPTKPSDTNIPTKNVSLSENQDRKITLADGSYSTYNYKLKADDNATNSTTQDFTVRIDKKKPNIYNIPSNSWTNTSESINTTATENFDESGLSSFKLYQVNNKGTMYESTVLLNTATGTTQNLTNNYTRDTEGKNINYRAIATDNAGNISSYDFSLNIDKTAPTLDSYNTISDFDKFTVNVKNENDHSMSGTKSIRYVVRNSVGTTVKDIIIPMVENGDNSTDFKESDLGSYGQYFVDIYTIDQVNNTQKITTLNATIYNPTVSNSALQVLQYDYKQDNADYWIKRDSNFQIQSFSSFPSSYPSYPSETQVGFGIVDYNSFLFGNYVDGVSPMTWASKIANGVGGSKFNNYFKLNQNIYNIGATEVTENNEKRLKAIFDMQSIKTDIDQDYKLYSSGNYNSTQASFKDSGIFLKTDGNAPTYSSTSIVDRQEDTIKVRISGIQDSRSGVKSVGVQSWVNNKGTNEYTQNVPLTKIDDSTYEFTLNRNNFGGNRRGYYYSITLTDNVGNTKQYDAIGPMEMLQYNLTANRIDIFDSRENRYVTQLISGQEYYAVVNYSNTGELDVNSAYNVGLSIDGKNINSTSGVSIKKGESKDVKIKFTAGAENLKGQDFKGIVDSDSNIDEEDETDNTCDSNALYGSPASDNNPPTIPPAGPDGKPSTIVPIITVNVDLVADYINTVDSTYKGGASILPVDDLIVGNTYKVIFKVKNASSLNIKYLDIKNKNFDNGIYYDGTLLNNETINISDIGAGATQTLVRDITIPDISNKISDSKQLKGVVDISNSIVETDETNNIKYLNKNIYSFRIENYRITDIVNPMIKYMYPIYTKDMPATIKTGYNVTLQCDVLGNADSVVAKLNDSYGTVYPDQQLKKVSETVTDGKKQSVYEYTITVPQTLPEGTIISSNLIGTRGVAVYDYKSQEKWNGETLKIGGDFKEDIIISRVF